MIKDYQHYTLTPHAIKRLKERFMVYGGQDVRKWIERVLSQAVVIQEDKSNRGIVQHCKSNDVIVIINSSLKTVVTVYPDGYYKYKEEIAQYESAMNDRDVTVSPEISQAVNKTLDTLTHKIIQRTSQKVAPKYQIMADVHTTLGRTRNYTNFDDKYDSLSAVFDSIKEDLNKRDKLLAEIDNIRL